jgi:hypothetical protein
LTGSKKDFPPTTDEYGPIEAIAIPMPTSGHIVGHSSDGIVQVFGSIPMRSLTADEIRWVQPR